MASVKKVSKVSKKATKAKTVKLTVVKSKPLKRVAKKANTVKKVAKAVKKVVKKAVKKPAKAVKAKAKVKADKTKKVKKNPNGSYTLHMHDKLSWLHSQAKLRGMQTSVFARMCIEEFVNTHPVVADESKAA